MKKLTISENLPLSISIVWFINGCGRAPIPASIEPRRTDIASQPEKTSGANMPLPTEVRRMVAQVEELAGFDVKEPTYLPPGVSLDYAT